MNIPVSELKRILDKLPDPKNYEREYFEVLPSIALPVSFDRHSSPTDSIDMPPVLLFRKNWRLREWELVTRR